jgi:hypothetical protein
MRLGLLLVPVVVCAVLPDVGLASNKAPLFNGPFNNTLNNVLTVALGCRIDNVKEIVVTNTTAATIPAGTVIGYDVVRYRSTSHYGGSVTSPRMLPGTQIRFGGEQSASCTAWYRQQLQRAP